MPQPLRSVPVVALVALVLGIAVAPLHAAGSSPKPKAPSDSAATTKSPVEQATEHYNAGLKLRDKAWALEAEARDAANPEQRSKLEDKAMKQFRRAIDELEMATEKNPRMHEAYSALGYASRRVGEHEAALVAYDRALQLAPDYAEAIEYRGQAYLGLDRIDDAKQAYIRLFTLDRGKADELLAAMKGWIASRVEEPGRVDRKTLDAFVSWVEKREQIAGQTASLGAGRGQDW